METMRRTAKKTVKTGTTTQQPWKKFFNENYLAPSPYLVRPLEETYLKCNKQKWAQHIYLRLYQKQYAETNEQNEIFFTKVQEVLRVYLNDWKPFDIPFKSSAFDYYILYQYAIVFMGFKTYPINEHTGSNPYLSAYFALKKFSSFSIFSLFPQKQEPSLVTCTNKHRTNHHESKLDAFLASLKSTHVYFPVYGNSSDLQTPIKLTGAPNLPAPVHITSQPHSRSTTAHHKQRYVMCHSTHRYNEHVSPLYLPKSHLQSFSRGRGALIFTKHCSFVPIPTEPDARIRCLYRRDLLDTFFQALSRFYRLDIFSRFFVSFSCFLNRFFVFQFILYRILWQIELFRASFTPQATSCLCVTIMSPGPVGRSSTISTLFLIAVILEDLVFGECSDQATAIFWDIVLASRDRCIRILLEIPRSLNFPLFFFVRFVMGGKIAFFFFDSAYFKIFGYLTCTDLIKSG